MVCACKKFLSKAQFGKNLFQVVIDRKYPSLEIQAFQVVLKVWKFTFACMRLFRSSSKKVNMIKDCQEITVKTVSFPHERGTVYYACSPYDIETIPGHRADRTADKIHLVSILQKHLVEMKGPSRTDCRFSDRADLPIQVVHDPLGRPQLLLGECEGPSISFSECGGKIWAALCGDCDMLSVSMRQGQMNFQQNTLFTGCSIRKSFNMP